MKLKTFLTLGLWRDRPSPILTHRVRGWYEGKHRDAILDLPGGSVYGEAMCYAGSKREAEEYEKFFSKAGFSTEILQDFDGVMEFDDEMWSLDHLYWCENCQVIIPRAHTRWENPDDDNFFNIRVDKTLGTLIRESVRDNGGDVRVHKKCGSPVVRLSDMDQKEVEKYVRKHKEAA